MHSPHDQSFSAYRRADQALDEAAYQRLAYDDGDGFAATAALNEALGPSPDPEKSINSSHFAREEIEAFLIEGSSDNLFNQENYEAYFVERYTSANQRGKVRARSVLGVRMHNRHAAGRGPWIKPIAEFIDLVSYPPVETIEEADGRIA